MNLRNMWDWIRLLISSGGCGIVMQLMLGNSFYTMIVLPSKVREDLYILNVYLEILSQAHAVAFEIETAGFLMQRRIQQFDVISGQNYQWPSDISRTRLF